MKKSVRESLNESVNESSLWASLENATDDDGNSFKIDEEKKIAKLYKDWSDDEFECETILTLNFNTHEGTQTGKCKNEDYQMPGPGYLQDFEYTNDQDFVFEDDDDIEEILADFNQWCSLFSHFAQQEAEVLQKEADRAESGDGDDDDDYQKIWNSLYYKAEGFGEELDDAIEQWEDLDEDEFVEKLKEYFDNHNVQQVIAKYFPDGNTEDLAEYVQRAEF